MKTKVIPDMPNAEYHDHPALSSTQLKTFARSAELFHACFIEKTASAFKATDAMAIGDATHRHLCDHAALDDIQVIPAEVLSKSGSKAGKPWQEYKEANAGKCILKHAEYVTVASMANAVHNALGDVFKADALYEHSIFWRDETTKLGLRCRPDMLLVNDDRALIIDFKTAADPLADKWVRAAKGFGYWLQAAMYCDGVEMAYQVPADFVFCAVGKDAPHQVRLYSPDKSDEMETNRRYRGILSDIAGRFEAGVWEDLNQFAFNPVSLLPWEGNR